MTVISLADERKKREPGPDASHVRVDERGRTLFHFAVSFRAGGEDYFFTLWAADFDEAERLVAGLRATATLDGQIFEERVEG